MVPKKEMSYLAKSKLNLVEYYLSPIAHYFEDDAVSEICVNCYNEIFIKKYGQMIRVSESFKSEDELKTLVTQIANNLGQSISSTSHPILDARLHDGTRVCAVLYPIATKGTSITFRLFPEKRITGEDLMGNGTLTREMFDYLIKAVITKANILVSGSTDSGKTTILNVLSEYIPKDDRVFSVEDTQELQILSENYISLEAPSRDRKREVEVVTMAKLIKTCLRKNPARIIVGEIRDKEAAIAFLHAINTGHCLSSTIHANHSDDALRRIQILAAEDGALPFEVVKMQVKSNLHVLVHAAETSKGRKIVEIKELNNCKTIPLWAYLDGKHIKIKESELAKKGY